MPTRDPSSMRDFWDEKARENAMYYISSYRAYDQQDPAEFWKWGAILAARFLDESGIPFTGEESILEIGCGIGRMTKHFAGRFRSVTGMDVSEEMIRQARENLGALPNVRLDVGNGTDLSAFPASSFDFVFSYIVFQHIPDRSVTLGYIREAGRVLRPGGSFYFQVSTLPPVRGFRSMVGRIRRATVGTRSQGGAGVGNGPRGLEHPAWRGSRVTLAQVRAAASDGNMHVERADGEGTQYTWVLARRPSQSHARSGVT